MLATFAPVSRVNFAGRLKVEFEKMAFFSNVTHIILGGAYLISFFSLFLLRSKIKSVGINLGILGFASLFIMSFLNVFTAHFFGLETIKEIALWRYLIECISFFIISIGGLIFSVGFKNES